jgi:multidrug efflux pump subunit AcrA (membrane-fusion protein)
MERMKKRILIALALCMALGTACGKKEVEEEKTLRSVEVTTVGKGDIASEFSYTGKAAPAKEVSVVPTVPGKVLSFNYDVGDKVGQGAVLFTVDSTDLQNNMRSLQASYNAAKLGRDNAKSTYDSNKLLYDEEIISKNEFDQIKYAYESADAQLASIQVQMDNLKKNISDCTVTSPMTGVIATRRAVLPLRQPLHIRLWICLPSRLRSAFPNRCSIPFRLAIKYLSL